MKRVTERAADDTARFQLGAFLILRICSHADAMPTLRFSSSGATSTLSRLRARALPSPVNLRRDKTPWQAVTRSTGSNDFLH